MNENGVTFLHLWGCCGIDGWMMDGVALHHLACFIKICGIIYNVFQISLRLLAGCYFCWLPT
jgi:hypothetical protein